MFFLGAGKAPGIYSTCQNMIPSTISPILGRNEKSRNIENTYLVSFCGYNGRLTDCPASPPSPRRLTKPRNLSGCPMTVEIKLFAMLCLYSAHWSFLGDSSSFGMPRTRLRLTAEYSSETMSIFAKIRQMLQTRIGSIFKYDMTEREGPD